MTLFIPMEQTLFIFLIVLSILIFVHEFGHFIVAKKAGIKVEEFGLGFPPRVLAKKIGETIYSINAFPIGGFVRLYGENEAQTKDGERSFFSKGKGVRALVSVAGVFMNLLLGVFAFAAISWAVGVPKETGQIRVLDILKDSPAQEAGLIKEDLILSADNQTFSKTQDFIQFVDSKKGETIALSIHHKDKSVSRVEITPRSDVPEGQGPLGIIITTTTFVKPPFYIRPVVALWEGVKEAVFWVKQVVVGVSVAIWQSLQGNPPQDLAGPVGIFQITGGAARAGVLPLVSLVGILSVNLAVLNVLPFPALDGGRLLFIAVEAITGRRVKPKVEHIAHTIGMVLLFLLLLLITMRDVNRLITSGFANIFSIAQ